MNRIYIALYIGGNMENKNYGTLQIRSYTASGALPVKDAVVKITGAEESNSYIQYSILTDSDGITKQIALPTARKEYSLSPNPKEAPYSIYDATISKEGYYTKSIKSIPIFEFTNAFLPIEMIPLSYDENGKIHDLSNINTTVYENEFL